jgi:RNA polymerase sigma factor (sigma-70 family)
MTFDDNFADLMIRAKAGESEAVKEFLAQFEQEVRMMVRARLPRMLRARYDSVDFVQSVWQSFFQEMGDDIPDFANADHLRGYLAGVVRNKVRHQHRRLTSGKYDMGREGALYVKRGGREVPVEVASLEPSPSEAVQAKDRLAQLMTGLEAHEAEIITMRRQGLKFDEIATRTGIHERTVRRIIDTARARWEARKCS